MTGERKREARRFLLPLSALLYVSDKDFTYIIYGVWEREGERERKRIYKISSLVPARVQSSLWSPLPPGDFHPPIEKIGFVCFAISCLAS